ncbi:MAG: alpha/beta fold hydrolase [Mycobacteriales bacterium]
MPILPGAEPFHHDGGAVGVLLCHGFTGTPQSMRPWGEHLAAAGLTVTCPRLPGHGTRWQDMNVTRWEDWYGEVERSFDALRGRSESVFVMGLSMGGTLSLRLAEQRGAEVSGLVLVNASLGTEDKRAKLLPVLSKVVASFPPVGNDIKKPGVTELAYDRLPLKAAASLQKLWALTRAELARVTQPLLVFRSREDHVVEPVSGRLLLEGVSSTEVEEHILEDSYHVATLDNDAPAIFAGSLEFVRQHSASVPSGG